MFMQALAKIDMNLLKGACNGQMDGAVQPQSYSHIKQIASSDVFRGSAEGHFPFSMMSFYKAIKAFGLMGKTVYYQFCPMMNDNKGAYWLSETNDIRNPYYGEAMPTCGETRETLKY